MNYPESARPEQASPTPDTGGSPLRVRQFRDLWLANAGSNFGSQIQIVGAGWLMSSLTTSPQLIASVQAAINAATVCLILAGGALADNFDRRRIMLVTQSSMLLLATLLAVLTWQNAMAPWSLILLTFLVSAMNSVNNPAWQASVRDILPRDMISRAVGLNSTSVNLARTVGPALGGFIIIAWGTAAAFIVNAVSFAGFLFVLFRWKSKPQRASVPREPLLQAMGAGLRYVSLAPHARNVVIRGGLSGIAASAFFALLPVVARQEMGGNAGLYGLLLAAFGAGAVTAAMLGGRLRSRFTPDRVVQLGSGSVAAGLVVLGLASQPWLAGVGAALGGGGWVLTHSTFITTAQLSAPQWVTARSLALYQMAAFAGMTLGSLTFGWVAEQVHVEAAMLAAAGVQAIAALVGLALPLPRYEDLHVDPLISRRPADLDAGVDPGDGPILVELHYVVPPDDVDAFLSAMTQRGRIRRRDGARDWAVWQDLGDRNCWVESYRVADWAAYLRHNSRRTSGDQDEFHAWTESSPAAERSTVKRFVKRTP